MTRLRARFCNIYTIRPPTLIVRRIARIAIQDVHEVLGNDPVRLLRRVELVVEEERVGRIRLVVVTHAAVQRAVVLETGDVGGSGAVEVLGRVREDVVDL